MSDISTPAPEPAPTAAAPELAKPKKQLLDNLVVKCLLTLVAWLAPLPVAAVLLNFWFSNYAPEDQRGADPFQAIRHSVVSMSGSTEDMILILSLVPSALLLLILHRSAAKRIFTIAALIMIAVGEALALMEVSGT
jgi:hypothetical protein